MNETFKNLHFRYGSDRDRDRDRDRDFRRRRRPLRPRYKVETAQFNVIREVHDIMPRRT